MLCSVIATRILVGDSCLVTESSTGAATAFVDMATQLPAQDTTIQSNAFFMLASPRPSDCKRFAIAKKPGIARAERPALTR
jgi:hypothetical protein